MSTPRLSALVVARNEEARLPRCLAALSFADEIVVVLDRTTDKSRAVAEAAEARVLEGGWEREGDRRNTGIEFCTGDWILEVDADELVGAELAAEIRATVASSSAARHSIPVDNHIGTHLVRYGWGASFGKSAYWGLFRKGTKIWGRERVHPKLTLTGAAGAPLSGRLHHEVDRNLSETIRRLDRYSSARAADLREHGDPDPTSRYVRRFFSRFWKCYVARKGYREGGYGLVIAALAGLFPLVSHLKARHETDEAGKG
jgi:glycosyltransferase involved in cell wall biosynthesis